MKKRLTAIACMMAIIATTKAAPASNTVEIVYNGTTATVSVAANISSYITDNSNGSSHVKLVQSASLNDAIGEITYILSGSSDDGEFYLDGSYKTTVELSGLTLTNPSGPAVNIQDGKRVKVKLTEGTTSTLSDGKNDNYNGCLHSKGHTEFRGKGTLNIKGNSKHAIYSKEYIQLKNSVINISGAVKDGIHCKEYFFMESGTVNITSAGDDGIQVEQDTNATITGATVDHEDENSGNFYQEDGKLFISGYEGKAIKADGAIKLTGGSRNFTIDDTETAISSLQNDTTENTEYYDLNGRKVKTPVKGIYIIKQGNKCYHRYYR